jgi:hypothetical protein
METSGMPINVVWLQESGEVAEYGMPLAAELAEMGIQVTFFSKLRRTHEHLLSQGFRSIFMSPDCFCGEPFTEKELAAIDEKYGAPYMSSIARANPQFVWYGMSSSAQIDAVARTYRYWERMFEQENFSYAIVKTAGPMEARTLYRVATQRGVGYGQIGPGCVEGTFSVNDCGEDLVWSELLELIQQGPRILSSEEKSLVWQHIPEDKEATKPWQANLRWSRSLLSYFRNPRGRWPYDENDKKSDPINYAAGRRVQKLFWEQLTWEMITSRSSVYQQPGNKPFFFFPLHHMAEPVTLGSVPVYCEQIELLVSEFALALPQGHELYVKEHPIHLGQWSRARLEQLKSVPNVRLIDPSIPALSLVKNSSGVITVDGTIGWEAFLRKIPVISLGTRFFSKSSLVFSLENPNNISSVIADVLYNGKSIYVENEDEWLWFIWCSITSCLSGDLCPIQYPYVPGLDKTNIKTVAESLRAKIRNQITLKK